MAFQGFAKVALKSVETGKNSTKVTVNGEIFNQNFQDQLIHAVGTAIQQYRDSHVGTTLTDEAIAKLLFAYTNTKGKVSYGISVELPTPQTILGVPVKFGRGIWVNLPLA
jgi:hypothetical protein